MIRGDVNYIRIGAMINIQDCFIVHVTNGMYPLNIGSMVTIGNSVILHGCITKDLCLLGMGTIVLDGAVVEGKALVAADSVIRPNFIAPSGKLVTGVPANIIRDLSDNEMKEFEKSAERYRKYTEIAIESLRNIKK